MAKHSALDFSSVQLLNFHTTFVGNKSRYEGISHPTSSMPDALVEELVIGGLVRALSKESEHFNMTGINDDDLSNLTELFENGALGGTPEFPKVAVDIVEDIFAGEDFTTSANTLSDLLYGSMTDPKIQGGEFMVLHVEGVNLVGYPATQAICLVKMGSKTPFLETQNAGGVSTVTTRAGYDFVDGAVEVAAIIFQTEAEGFTVVALDKMSARYSRSFWMDDFLRLVPEMTDFRHTCLTMEMMATYAEVFSNVHQLPIETRADLRIRIRNYFLDNEEFESEDIITRAFCSVLDTVDEEREVEAFSTFKKDYCYSHVALEDYANLDRTAVKKMAKLFTVRLKVDNNFVINVSSGARMIERGFDEDSGNKFLKIKYDALAITN